MRNEMWKRIAAALLCLAMLAGCLAFAEDGEVTGEPVEGVVETVEGAVTGADEANVGAAADEAPQEGAVDVSDDEDALPPEGGASNGDEVEQKGDDVEQTGDDVDQKDDDVEQTGDDVDPADDVDDAPVEDEETDGGLVDNAQNDAAVALLNEDNGIMLMAAAPTDCAGGHSFVEAEPVRKVVGVASCDESGHILNYEIITGQKCTKCGLYNPDTYKVTQETGKLEAHNYANTPGVCSVCNYTCKHTGAKKTLSNNVVWNEAPNDYRVLSEEQHVHCGYKILLFECDCGIKSTEAYPASGANEPYEAAPEPHRYAENGNTCLDCGHEKSCENGKHDWVDVLLGVYAEEFAPSAEGCVGTHIYRIYDHWCQKCDTSYEVRVDDPNPEATLIYEHDFGGGTGVCSRCGYKPDCKHERREILAVQQSDVLSSGKLQPNGNGTHSGKFVEATSYHCLDCGYEWSETRTVEGIRPCEYGEDGKCICGATRQSCEHKWSGKEEDIVRKYNYSDFSAAKDNGDGTHTFATYTYSYDYVCSVCGAVVEGAKATGKDYVQPHYTHEGFGGEECEDCGAPLECAHEHIVMRPVPEAEPRRIGRKDQENHSITYSAGTYCLTCGAYVETKEFKLNSITVDEPHEWLENGVCRLCGEVRACAHEKLHEATPVVKKTYKEIPGNEKEHQVVVESTYTCPTCLVSITETSAPKVEPHDYKEVGDGIAKCAAEGCGHVCKHLHIEPDLALGQDFERFEQKDDAEHLVIRRLRGWCDDCNIPVLTEQTISEAKPHDYVDGVCTTEIKGQVCGHVCAHSNKKLDADSATRVENDKPVSDNDNTHSKGYTLTTPWTCPDCKKSGTEVTQHPTGDPVRHSYKLVDGEYVCEACGRKCTHSGVTPAVETKVTYPEAGISQYGHTPRTTTTTTLDCPHGHEKIVTSETVEGVSEAHKYDGKGVCADCGFACAHPMTVQEEEPRNIRYTSNGAQGHTVTYDMCNVTRCYYCKVETEEPEVINAGLTETEAHSFSGDTCTLCGYKKPAAPKPTATPAPAPTEQPVVTDEPVFQEVAPEEPVHGVTADSSTRMATALVQAIEGIQSDYGARATVEIRDAEKVFTAQESATFTKLPVQEQMLVLLTVLGYEDEVSTGMDEVGITLSAEAEDLIRVTYERITAMDEAEFAQFMAMVGEIFPVTQSADGQHVEITLEIRGEDGAVRYERYGFDFVDGAWVFSKLEVAENAATAAA